jgi:hypothetical protein
VTPLVDHDQILHVLINPLRSAIGAVLEASVCSSQALMSIKQGHAKSKTSLRNEAFLTEVPTTCR